MWQAALSKRRRGSWYCCFWRKNVTSFGLSGKLASAQKSHYTNIGGTNRCQEQAWVSARALMHVCRHESTSTAGHEELIHGSFGARRQTLWLHNCSSGWLKVMLVASRRQRRLTATQLMQQTGRFPSSHMTQSKANYEQCCCLAHRSGCTAFPTAFCMERKEQPCLLFFDKFVFSDLKSEMGNFVFYFLFFIWYFFEAF